MATAVSSPSPSHPRVLGSGRLTRSGRPRLVQLSAVERSYEESRVILYPSQKKLSTVESQRVMTVTKEMRKRVEGALLLTPQLPDHLDRFGVAMGTELVAKIRDHHTLSRQYESLYEQLIERDIEPHIAPKRSSLTRPSLPHNKLEPIAPNPSPEELQIRFYSLQQQLRDSTRSLLRSLQQCPSIDAIARELKGSAPPRVDNVLNQLGEVVKLMEETLLTTHEEEVKRTDYLSIISERRQVAEGEIASLQSELQHARNDMNREVQKREDQKRKLLYDIRMVDKLAKQVQSKIEEDTSKQEAANQSSHNGQVTKMSEEITTLKRTLQETKAANKEIESQLRKKSFKRETEADNWIQKYDNEIGDLQNELETLDEEFTEEKKQVKEIGERLEVLSIEYEVVVKEQEEARKKAEEAHLKLTSMVQAATIIQSCWRSYKIRKLLHKDQKKGGKKGGKGGKKGGKKGSGKKGSGKKKKA